jgi:uncharacterized membrane protein
LPWHLTASFALAVETEELGIAGGLQDRIAQSYGGLVFMDFARMDYETLPRDLLPPLLIAWRDDTAADSGPLHSDLRARYEHGEPLVRETMVTLAAAARAASEALQHQDRRAFGASMDATLAARQRLLALDARHLEMIEVARSCGVAANYTGSGGAIVAACRDGGEQARVRTALGDIGCGVPPNPCRVSTNRLEAFSDGVLAVAITLLVLNIRVPDPASTENLLHALLSQWPAYVAYVTSFITIGIIWINHHVMISRLRQADHPILALNLLLLLSIGVLPFSTDLAASYLKEGHGQHLAAAVYGASFLVMSIFFAILNRHILLSKVHYLDPPLSGDLRRAILRRSLAGLVPYVIATALAPVSAYLTVFICAAIAAYYALPIASGAGLQSAGAG